MKTNKNVLSHVYPVPRYVTTRQTDSSFIALLMFQVLTGGKVKYESLSGAGSLPLQESISWDVTVVKSETGEDKASADGPSPNVNKDRSADAKTVSTPRSNQGILCFE